MSLDYTEVGGFTEVEGSPQQKEATTDTNTPERAVPGRLTSAPARDDTVLTDTGAPLMGTVNGRHPSSTRDAKASHIM
jgi:hypothetical protein